MTRWWIRLLRYAPAHAAELLAIVVLILGSSALEVLRPWPLKLIVDSVLAGKPLPGRAAWIAFLPGAASQSVLLFLLTAATVVLFLAGWLARSAQAYLQVGVGSRLTYALAADVFEHLQRLSLRFHGKHPTGDLVRRLTSDTSCVRDLIVGVCLPLIGALLSLAPMFVVMWRVDRMLSLVAMLVTPGLAVAIRVFARPMTERSYEEMRLKGELMTVAERTLSALPVVQTFGGEEAEDRRFADICQRANLAHLRVIGAQLRFKASTSTLTALGTAAVMLLGGLHVLQGKLSVGSLLVFLSYLVSLYAPLETIAFLSDAYANAAAGARRVFEVLRADDAVQDVPGASALPARIDGRIRIERLVFGYQQGRPVLEGVDLEVHAGETLALVGQTGAGKSTVVSMILRFFDPWEGRVTVDGLDIRSLQLASLRSKIAVVLQEPFLMPMTVAENIAYGRPGARQEEIHEAAVAANADEFIRTLPEGYNAVLGERGATLSGGQKQRLAIARAFLKNAPILILDEPSSALDSESESLLVDALERLKKGRTTIIIAHKLSTIRQADRVAVIEHGRIRETGRHTELMSTGGIYQRMQELQFGVRVAAGGRLP